MPPRRSVARGSSATPARDTSPSKRSTRGNSVLPQDGSVRKRTARQASQRPETTNSIIINSNLPEIQTQQSYAYGSTTVPRLPDQLYARETMSLKQIAQTIDVGVQEAEYQLQDHIAGTTGNAHASAREQRARRRASRDGSHDSAAESDNYENRKSARTAAWADSLDSDQLDGIPEEESAAEEDADADADADADEDEDNDSHHNTEPSSFPSGIDEHSYAYERGLRKPNPQRSSSASPSTPSSARRRIKELYVSFVRKAKIAARSLGARTDQSYRAALEGFNRMLKSTWYHTLLKVLLSILVATSLAMSFCSIYTNFLCDPFSSSSAALSLQRLCGSCHSTPSLYQNFSGQDPDSWNKLTLTVQSLDRQIRRLESKLEERLDSKYSAIKSDLKSLKYQQAELSHQLEQLENDAGMQTQNAGLPSPLLPSINYFSPGNGALINPRQTSPTRQKPFPLAHRVLMRALGTTKYRSKPPITALEPWQDAGDCWCSSDIPGTTQENVRLGVAVRELIYPTELVVEHLPAAGSLSPKSTPRDIELWADFGHLNDEEFKSLQIRQMQQGNAPLGSSYVIIGRAVYDITRNNHVQTFRLDVNTVSTDLRYHSQHFVIRIASNYGAAHTCLYRVRLHGVPVKESGSPDKLSI